MYKFKTSPIRDIAKYYFFYICLFLILFICIEVVVGYYLYQSNTSKELAIRKFSNNIHNYFLSEINGSIDKKSGLSAPDNFTKPERFSTNPFISNAPDGAQIRFHPFLGFTNTHHSTGSFNNDFFGFRNSNNIYFSDRNESDFIVLMTGGSECAGYSHLNETILEIIQKKLQATAQKKKIKILNLCMNSYTITSEIQSYILLAYKLKPDVVISHSGWNDAIYGLLVSSEFVKTGLIYNKWQEAWIEKFYGSSKNKFIDSQAFANPHFENKKLIIENYWNQVNKYKYIVEQNQGHFILGIQGYNKYIANDGMMELHHATHSVMSTLIDQLPSDVSYLNINTLEGIKFIDSCHTSQKSAELIADKYYTYIYKKFYKVL